jgi:4'-phosphopantetheinyl transferase
MRRISTPLAARPGPTAATPGVTLGAVDGPAGSPWGPLTLPPRTVLPAPGTCHLWSAPTTEQPGYAGLLDEAERCRVDRFKLASARSAFIASRAGQRLVVGHYLGLPAGSVTIARDCRHCGAEHGRPYVRDAPLDFSVSHTKGWLLVAVVADGKVGVDVEVVTAARAADELARQVLGPAEQERFLLLPRSERAAAFIRAWTRKEAAVKLTGHGIAAPFRHLDVTSDLATTSLPPPGWPADPIHLRDLPPAQDLAAALASTVPIEAVVHCGPIPAPPT